MLCRSDLSVPTVLARGLLLSLLLPLPVFSAASVATTAVVSKQAPFTEAASMPDSSETIKTPAVVSTPLTIERLFAAPDLAGVGISQARFAPDGERVSFLRNRENDMHRRDLWQWTKDQGAKILLSSDALAGVDESLSEAEKARRERLRLFARGFTEYEWHPSKNEMLLPIGGEVWQYDMAAPTPALTQVSAIGNGVSDVHYSPQARYISFVREQNLFVFDQQKQQTRALTLDGGGALSNGTAEFVAQEELDRFDGYWWSSNEQYLAFAQVDESKVNIEQRYDINADQVVVHAQRYPRAGSNNAAVKIGVLDLLDDHISWLDLNPKDLTAGDYYIARVQWLPDHRTLAVQRLSRDQKTLDLLFVDVMTRRVRTVLTERSDTWINLHNDLRFLKKSAQFLWSSERSGYRHLYLYNNDGKLQKQLTDGRFMVTALNAVDEEQQLVYVSANADTPLEQHLYALSLAGAATAANAWRRLTEAGYWHGAGKLQFALTADKSATQFIDSYSGPNQPPALRVLAANGTVLGDIARNDVSDEQHPWHAYAASAVTPEFGFIKAEDGQDLFYRLYKPAQMIEGKRYPVIVHIYGGPHSQLVRRAWDEPFHQLLAQQGFVVFTLDNRGMANRGVAFEKPLYRQLGGAEIRDQQAGVKFLRSLDFVDGEHIGMFGWSYGGYMTVMALAKAPQDFAAGVAVAPVSDWRLYDSAYTERYLGDPATDAQAYERSALWPYLKDIKGHLLLVHGMADDNVLFSHSTALMQKLQMQNTAFELMTYPGAKHSIFEPKQRIHLYHLLLNYFQRTLQIAEPVGESALIKP